ncbi:uncharacterized protein N7496_010633 [Penicillium cataractarum]|uniref:Uncharacterized protein n=1 Tax=Penicillium cataractarum TaxID=2100454 RepID=A0A9W9RSN7_9EURO|nr:uncharacterized protein N7496_010633 [Penicillium cataractarum]KAJ5364920.1 hypothetical protein N7496_010633 [Penicillium cataractarum]
MSAGIQLEKILAQEWARFKREIEAAANEYKAKMQKLEDAQGDIYLNFDSFSKNLEKQVEVKWQKKFHE